MPSLAIVYRSGQALILPCKADLDLWFLFIIESAILNAMTETLSVLFGSLFSRVKLVEYRPSLADPCTVTQDTFPIAMLKSVKSSLGGLAAVGVQTTVYYQLNCSF